ncbi:Erythromycin esterase [Burkholderiales bacterium 8X]|nr:Erythromycin esterase [Burkholderiales bacterium 8X]
MPETSKLEAEDVAANSPEDQEAIAAIRRAAAPVDARRLHEEPLLRAIANARFVLLGEASHGTEDFYRERASLTRALIVQKGFRAVAVEADWPDALRVNRYVRGQSDDRSAAEALSSFTRFPTWMWRNHATAEFIEWVRQHNAESSPDDQVGFYGIDLYSLYGSIEAVLAYLDEVDPEAAKRARYRYGCFEQFAENLQAYGYAAAFDLTASCEKAAVAQLRELMERSGELARRDGENTAMTASSRGSNGPIAADAHFYAEQNARLVRNAERYYRSMFGGRIPSWNVRDTHMADTLDALDGHLSRDRPAPARIAIWAHNSHLGDARATEMSSLGELNVGQLMRERHGDECFSVGFTTYDGQVTAAPAWDRRAEIQNMRPGLEGSVEALMHDSGIGIGRFQLIFGTDDDLKKALAARRLERAIGVIYAPATERQSHYFEASLSSQFDALIHMDRTGALMQL